jgi:putative oxidoreductase
LKFFDPTSIRDLLAASLTFLAFNGFVYVLGTLEIIAGILLLIGKGLRYIGLLCVLLFIGTLTIFLIAPTVTYAHGFPFLSMADEFLLKDLVLAAAAVSISAMDVTRQHSRLTMARMS